MTKSNVYRFSVKNQAGEFSQVWRIWVVGSDVYVDPRGITQSYKASFHESGTCHVGISSEVRRTLLEFPEWEGKSRHYDSWEITSLPNQRESVELVDIIIPCSQLDIFDVKHQSKINWLECSEGQCASISIFKANMAENAVVKSSQTAFRHLCSLSLKNGIKVIVLFRLIGERSEYLELMKAQVLNADNPNNERTYSNGEYELDDSNVRAMIWHKSENGRRIWFEASVKKLNM